MSDSTGKENKMGVMPIPKLLFTMSLPIILSMLVQALYNIVDSMFVARLNENALTAVSLTFPIQNLIIAVASGTGVGINSLLSRNLGEKNYEAADRAASNGLFLGFMSSLAFAVLGGLCSGVFFIFRQPICRSSATAHSICESLRSVPSAFSCRLLVRGCFKPPGKRSML